MSGTEAIDFLTSIAGYTRHATDSSADRPLRLAVVDPAYVSGAAKVTFEGESTLSVKAYYATAAVFLRPSARVVLVPVGTTYLIAGVIPSAGGGGQGGYAGSVRLTSGSQATTAGAEAVWAASALAVPMVSGRRYGLTAKIPVDSGASTDHIFRIRIRNSKTASTPTTASTEIAQITGRTGNTVVLAYTLIDQYVADTTGTNTLALTVARVTGANEINISTATFAAYMQVDDLGT